MAVAVLGVDVERDIDGSDEHLGVLGVFLHRHVGRRIGPADQGGVGGARGGDRIDAGLGQGPGGSGIGHVGEQEGARLVQRREPLTERSRSFVHTSFYTFSPTVAAGHRPGPPCGPQS
ncbi:MAG: hypothetical protein R2695_12400 [Acidimicrobiales bacterium]